PARATRSATSLGARFDSRRPWIMEVRQTFVSVFFILFDIVRRTSHRAAQPLPVSGCSTGVAAPLDHGKEDRPFVSQDLRQECLSHAHRLNPPRRTVL